MQIDSDQLLAALSKHRGQVVEALVVPANADSELAWMKRMIGVAQGIDFATELVKELVKRTVEGDQE